MHARCLEGVVQVGAQQRVRADLDENVVVVRDKPLGRLFETHGFAHVAPPVIGSQCRAINDRAGNGGIERHFAGARPDARQRAADIGLDAVHGGAMEAIVQIKPAEGYGLFGQYRFKDAQRRRRTGYRGAAVAVVGRDADGIVQVVQGDQGLRFFTADANRRHVAQAFGLALESATLKNKAHGIGQIHRPARPRGGHFANAVADHCPGNHAAVRQHAGDAHLQGKQRGLRDLGSLVAVVAVFSGQFFVQRKVGVLREQRIDFVYRRGEDGVGQQAAAHVGPL
ncbi:hypothetical protein D3C86_785070 [compost metagenome]